MKQRRFRFARFALRWAIAIGGIWWVVAQMSLRDATLHIPDGAAVPERVTVVADPGDSPGSIRVLDPQTRAPIDIPRDRTVSKPDGNGRTVRVRDDDRIVELQLLGLDLIDDRAGGAPRVRRLLVGDTLSPARFVRPVDLADPFTLRVPNPRVETGVIRMVQQADSMLLLAAVAVFPVTYLVTTIRWHRLLRGLQIQVSLARAFVLNMVGAFYNAFLLGSTGGDVIKAIYASRQTPHKAAAVISVIVDRVLGLITLIILGGAMAAWQYAAGESREDPVTRACGQVALACALMLTMLVVGVAVLGATNLRKRLGVDWILRKLPGQKFIEKILDVLRLYRARPGLILWALVITLPVHLTVIFSALLAGKAFDLPVSTGYYFVVVPVIVLVGAIPISPQGAGVMEFFATLLLAREGATAGHAVALTMSIRLVQILWNLTGAIFVLKGGFHAPTQKEIDEVEDA